MAKAPLCKSGQLGSIPRWTSQRPNAGQLVKEHSPFIFEEVALIELGICEAAFIEYELDATGGRTLAFPLFDV